MDKKKKVLISFDTVRPGFEELAEWADMTRRPEGESFTREEMMEIGAQYDALATQFTFPVDRELIDAFPNIKLIANYGVGYNNIDVAYAHSKGITVTNTPRAVIQPTAELTMGLLLSCSRKIAMWDRHMRRTKSSSKSLSDSSGMATNLCGKTIGIIGYGNIGRAVGHMAQAFGMTVLYNKRHQLDAAAEKELGVTYADLDKIFTECDVVSLHTPYNEDSHHLVSASRLAQMKCSAILINAARGAVVDEAALVHALQTGEIAAAGLDVFEHSDNPLPELYEMEQVTMTPHVGTQTYEARVAMARELCNCIIGYFEGDRPISIVR